LKIEIVVNKTNKYFIVNLHKAL